MYTAGFPPYTWSGFESIFLKYCEQDDPNKLEVLGTFKNVIYRLRMFLSEKRTVIRNCLKIYSQTYLKISQENMVHSEMKASK